MVGQVPRMVGRQTCMQAQHKPHQCQCVRILRDQRHIRFLLSGQIAQGGHVQILGQGQGGQRRKEDGNDTGQLSGPQVCGREGARGRLGHHPSVPSALFSAIQPHRTYLEDREESDIPRIPAVQGPSGGSCGGSVREGGRQGLLSDSMESGFLIEHHSKKLSK